MISTTTSLRLGVSKSWPFRAYNSRLRRIANYRVNLISQLLVKKFYTRRFRNINILYSHSIIRYRGRFLVIYCYMYDEYINRFMVDLIRNKFISESNIKRFRFIRFLVGELCRTEFFATEFMLIARDLIACKFASVIIFKVFILAKPSQYNVLVLGNYIKRRLIQGYSLNEVVGTLINGLSNFSNVFGGIKFKCIGRFTRAQRVATHYFRVGKIAFNTFSEVVDYNHIEPILKYSICSIKIWVNYNFSIDVFPYKLLESLYACSFVLNVSKITAFQYLIKTFKFLKFKNLQRMYNVWYKNFENLKIDNSLKLMGAYNQHLCLFWQYCIIGDRNYFKNNNQFYFIQFKWFLYYGIRQNLLK